MFLIAGQVLAYLGELRRRSQTAARRCSDGIRFEPDKVLQGEWWRLVTFLFDPPLDESDLFAFFFWYLFYLMGTTLEANWGAFRYNVYLLMGYVASIAMAFVAWFAGGVAGQIGVERLSLRHGVPGVRAVVSRLRDVHLLRPAGEDSLAGAAAVDHVRRDDVVFAESWLDAAMVVAAVFNYLRVLRPRHLARREAGPSADAVPVAEPAGRHESGRG